MRLLLLAAILACAWAFDHDTQSVKSVKGGHGFQYQGGDISRFYNNNTFQHGSSSSYGGLRPGQPGQMPGQGYRPPIDFEIGVCYVEVPTANLVRDKTHIPAGNGSRPELSRIRTCCKGYERNVYNFKICEPVCTKECVNALCTAPDTCTCYPDHVRNLAGICVATCPIGCQNGRCDGGECLCNEGFKLDREGRFCVPNCRDNCGGIGNCTAPNTCSCKDGYQSSPDGSCRISCGKCENGDCVSANECRCRSGYAKDSQGLCMAHCSQPCAMNERCIAPNVCSLAPGQGPGPAHPPGPSPTNSQNPYGPGQNNTYYYNPNQGSNYPLYPYNQNGPQQPNSSPNQGSGYPQPNTAQGQNNQPSPYQPQQGSGYPHPNSNQPQQGSGYPNPNSNQPQQGSNYPQTNPNQQGNNNPYPNPNQSQQGSNYPSSNPNHSNQGSSNYPQPNPIYHNQGSNYPQYPYGQNPQNNSFNGQYPNQPNQGSYQPTGQAINVTYPQHQLYPDNQLGPNRTNPSNNPGQQYPDNQRPGQYNPGSYPYNQGANQPSYPTQQHGYYPNQGPYNPYDQNQEDSQCAQPCVNGLCIGHNTCRCNPGYVTDEMDPSGNRCRPHCPGGCPNGYCAAPHACACDEGYYRDTSIKGRVACVRRIRRSLQELVFMIPDYGDQ